MFGNTIFRRFIMASPLPPSQGPQKKSFVEDFKLAATSDPTSVGRTTLGAKLGRVAQKMISSGGDSAERRDGLVSDIRARDDSKLNNYREIAIRQFETGGDRIGVSYLTPSFVQRNPERLQGLIDQVGARLQTIDANSANAKRGEKANLMREKVHLTEVLHVLTAMQEHVKANPFDTKAQLREEFKNMDWDYLQDHKQGTSRMIGVHESNLREVPDDDFENKNYLLAEMAPLQDKLDIIEERLQQIREQKKS